MRQNFHKNNCGFTLIETIIYIALFAIIMGGGLAAAYGVIEGSDKTSSRAIVEQEGIFLLRKLNWAMTGITDTNDACVSGSVLKIKSCAVPAITFSVNGTVLEMNGAPLTSANVKASSVSFIETSAVAGGRPKSIKASFWLAGTKGNSQQFETTKYLRQ